MYVYSKTRDAISIFSSFRIVHFLSSRFWLRNLKLSTFAIKNICTYVLENRSLSLKSSIKINEFCFNYRYYCNIYLKTVRRSYGFLILAFYSSL